MEENVTLVINNNPIQITKEKLSEYEKDSKYMVKKLEEEKDKYLLLEKMLG